MVGDAGHRAGGVLAAARRGTAEQFVLAEEWPGLQRMCATVEHAFGHLVTAPPIFEVAPAAATLEGIAREAIALAFQRYALHPVPVEVRLEGTNEFAGRIALTQGRVTLSLSQRWAQSVDALYAVVAHEFAHCALESAGIRYSSREDNERLADAAAALVGFGPIMALSHYREERLPEQPPRWEIVRMGHLHPIALALLSLVQAEKAGVSVTGAAQRLGPWGPLGLACWKTVRG